MTSSNRQVRPSRRGGFTLLEMVVVIAIITLLVTLLVPTVRGALEYTRAVICGNNLHQLAGTLRISSGPGTYHLLPLASEWYTYVIDHGARDVLVCPSDDGDPDLTEHTGLSDTYIVQNANLFTNIQDALDLGHSLEDRQILVNPPGIAGDHGWNPPDPSSDQALICIDDDAAIMITFGDGVTIESLDPPGDGGACGSDHWICVDDGSPNWRSNIESVLRGVRGGGTPGPNTGDPGVVMRLTGRNYANKIEAPYVVGRQSASYGMSTAVQRTAPHSGQLMLVEYNTSVVHVSRNFTNLDQSLRPRHRERAYFVTTGGSVDSITVDDLELEFDGSPTRGIWGPIAGTGQ